MKKTLRVMVACVVTCCCFFAASPSIRAAESITIAGIVFQDDEFMNDIANGMKKAADEAGVTRRPTPTTINRGRWSCDEDGPPAK